MSKIDVNNLTVLPGITFVQDGVAWRGSNIEPQPDADQDKPKGCYVYAHCDEQDNAFYIGMGTGRRAWSRNRHKLWVRYVEKHLHGKYQVQILADNLAKGEAEEVENAFMAQQGDNLLNCFNLGRSLEFEVLEQYSKLKKTNRGQIQTAKATEKDDLELAAKLYIKAIEDMHAYAFMKYQGGLLGKLQEEEAGELGHHGELDALDRLTMCLIKLGRPREASERMKAYFTLYRKDLCLKGSERITRRVEKALARVK